MFDFAGIRLQYNPDVPPIRPTICPTERLQMNDTLWGALFLVYILLALPLLSLQAQDLAKDATKDTPRTKKLGWAWVAGLCVLVLAWAL